MTRDLGDEVMREAAEDVVRRTLAAPATLGRGRLLCIDGPAGSGKSTLAAVVLSALPSAVTRRVVHLDDVYPGWSGLADGVARVSRLLVEPLSHDEPGGYRRYDWLAGAEAEWHDVPPVDLLVLDGVGSGAPDYADRITTLVWMEAPSELRLDRGMTRDRQLYGTADEAAWLRWRADEDAVLAAHRTRERADLVVAGV